MTTFNSVYRTSIASFADPGPPRRFTGKTATDIPFHADWSEYRERLLLDVIGWLARMIRERGLNTTPLFHNYSHPLNPGAAASGFTTPFNLIALEREVDFVGFNMYSRKERYDHVKTVVSYVTGSSRFPTGRKLIGGSWPWYQQPPPTRNRHQRGADARPARLQPLHDGRAGSLTLLAGTTGRLTVRTGRGGRAAKPADWRGPERCRAIRHRPRYRQL